MRWTTIVFTLGLTIVASYTRECNGVTIETAAIGRPNNAADQTGLGSVGRSYRMAKHEITNSQYAEFLNAVAADDPYSLFSPGPVEVQQLVGIVRSGAPGSYTYAVKPDVAGQSYDGSVYSYTNKPVVYVSWFDAARFANWMHNGQPSGAPGPTTTEEGAYTFSGATTLSARNQHAKWFIPSRNEWYKAAFFDGDLGTYYDYALGSDAFPNNNAPPADNGNSANFLLSGLTTGIADFPMTDVGAYASSTSPWGTFDQAGNVWELIDLLTPGNGVFAPAATAGGSYIFPPNYLLAPTTFIDGFGALDGPDIGFRLATVPEPAAATLTVLASVLVVRGASRAAVPRTCSDNRRTLPRGRR